MNNQYKFIENDKERKLKHAHILDEVQLTGTTSVIDVLGKNLTWWAAEMAAVTCLETGEKIETIRKEYLEACSQDNKKEAIDKLQIKYPLFKKARFAHFEDKNTKADKGTDMHADLEKYVKYCIEQKKGEPTDKWYLDSKKVCDFRDWAVNNIKKFWGSEIYVYHKKLWIGGITDCIAELKDGTWAIIDFKSSKEAFFSQFIQCALYAIQFEANGGFDKEGNKILEPHKIDKFIVFPFGAKELKPIENNNINQLQEAAVACVQVYRAQRAFEGK